MATNRREGTFLLSILFATFLATLVLIQETNGQVVCVEGDSLNLTSSGSDNQTATKCVPAASASETSETQVVSTYPKEVPRRFFEIDQTIATIIAVSVTLTAVVITVIIIVCCFWSKCPLYSCCRVQYTADLPTLVEKGEDVNIKSVPTDDNDSQRTLVLSNNSNGKQDRSDNPVVAV